LNSLVNQTHSNFEVFICDDGSDFKPDLIIAHFSESLKIHYLWNKTNVGIAETYKKLINEVINKKDIAIYFAQDDIMKQNYVEEVIKYFIDENCVYVYPILTSINEKGNLIGKHITPINLEFIYGRLKSAAMVRANFVTSPGSALRLSVFENQMLDNTNNLMHDWQQSLYLSIKGKFSICYGSTLYYRVHNESTSYTHIHKFEDTKTMIQNFITSETFKSFYLELSIYKKFIYRKILSRSIALLEINSIASQFKDESGSVHLPSSLWKSISNEFNRSMTCLFINQTQKFIYKFLVNLVTIKYCIKSFLRIEFMRKRIIFRT
jgi:glycosyltransferase involved in cell wall biosynthesis